MGVGGDPKRQGGYLRYFVKSNVQIIVYVCGKHAYYVFRGVPYRGGRIPRFSSEVTIGTKPLLAFASERSELLCFYGYLYSWRSQPVFGVLIPSESR